MSESVFTLDFKCLGVFYEDVNPRVLESSRSEKMYCGYKVLIYDTVVS